MEISSATIQLVLLFIPGLFWAMLDAAHRPESQSGQFIYTLRVFVFGVISYAVVGCMYRVLDEPFDVMAFSHNGWEFSDAIDEIFWAVLTSLLFAIIWIAGRTHKIITRALNKIGVTNHIADQDIWEFIFNSDTPKIKYAHVRDYENDLIYAGYIQAYSERMDLRELAMYEVEVYTGDAEMLYEAPYLYISRPINGVTLEFPHKEVSNGKRPQSWFRKLQSWWSSIN